MFSETPELQNHKDVQIFKNFLNLCFNILLQDSFLLAYNIKARLNENIIKREPLISKLVQESDTWLNNMERSILIPTHDLNFASPHDPLRFAILVGYDGLLSQNEAMVVCRWSEKNGSAKIQVLNLVTKDIVATVKTVKPIPFQITNDNLNFVYCDGECFYMYKMDGGELCKSFLYCNNHYRKVSVRNLTLSINNKYAALVIKCYPDDCKLYILEIKTESVHSKISTNRRHPPDKLIFVNNDESLLAVSPVLISLYSVSNLENSRHFDGFSNFISQHAILLPNTNYVLTPLFINQSIRVIQLDYSDEYSWPFTLSQNVHPLMRNKIIVFGFCIDTTRNLIGVGSYSSLENDKTVSTYLCIWNYVEKSSNFICVKPQGLKPPATLAIQSDWSHSFVGWCDGVITIIDLDKNEELWSTNAHSQSVNDMTILSNGTMITMAKDHSLKIWDIDCLTKHAHQSRSEKLNLKRSDATLELALLDENEQCLDIAVLQNELVTAPIDGECSPRFWKLNSGEFVDDISEKLRLRYLRSCGENDTAVVGKSHSLLHIIDRFIIYERLQRNEIIVFVAQIHPREVYAHKRFTNAFFSIVLPEHIDQGKFISQNKYIVLKNESIEIYGIPLLQPLKSITTPSILNDVKHLWSKTGRQRIMSNRIGVTCDGKYFVILNNGRVYGSPNEKFFDIIDLQEGKFHCRISNNPPVNIVDHSIIFLAFKSKNDACIFTPSYLLDNLKTEFFIYACPIFTGKFLSKDTKLGVQCGNENHAVQLWNLFPLGLIHTFQGHVHHVTSCDFTKDYKYLVTGSYDKTVRIWSIDKGLLECMFYTNASVDKLLFSPNDNFIVALCYSAPQRKKAIILQVRNLKSNRIFKRGLSRYDS